MITIYKYVVIFYDDMEEKDMVNKGYVIAENYKEAMEKVTKYYGDDSIDKVFLSAITYGSLIEIEEMTPAEDDIGYDWTGPIRNVGW